MLISLSVDWWEQKTHEEQAAYLKEHPGSKKKPTKHKTTVKSVPKKTAKAKKRLPSEIMREGLGDNPTPQEVIAFKQIYPTTVGAARLIKLAKYYDFYDHSKWSEKAFASWYDDITPEEAESVAAYTFKLDREVNHLLRTGTKLPYDPKDRDEYDQDTGAKIKFTQKEVEDHIKNIDSALEKSSLDKDMTVFRGLSLSGQDGKSIADLHDLLNKGITDKGYMSTTTLPSSAMGFLNKGGGGSVALAIALKKGSKVGSIGEGIARKGSIADPQIITECEVLLPRNSTIVPTKIEEMKNEDWPPRYIVHAEVQLGNE
jgi:hypothetical protein